MERPGERQYFYLAPVRSWSFADRSGPEFADSSRGEYQLQAIPLTVAALAAIDLKPDQVAGAVTHSGSARPWLGDIAASVP